MSRREFFGEWHDPDPKREQREKHEDKMGLDFKLGAMPERMSLDVFSKGGRIIIKGVFMDTDGGPPRHVERRLELSRLDLVMGVSGKHFTAAFEQVLTDLLRTTPKRHGEFGR